MNASENLDVFAHSLGYDTERVMLHDLYITHNMSTTAISKALKVRSQSNIRLRLIRLGIPLRKKGGYNGRRKKEGEPLDGLRSHSPDLPTPNLRSE